MSEEMVNLNFYDILSLPLENKVNKRVRVLPKPPFFMDPKKALPIWLVRPLQLKMPMIDVPEKIKEPYTRGILGENLIHSLDPNKFEIYDPYCYEVRYEYSPLHDKNLKKWINRPNNKKLLEKTKDIHQNREVCNLKEYNDYRSYIHKIQINHVTSGMKKEEEFKREQAKIKQFLLRANKDGKERWNSRFLTNAKNISIQKYLQVDMDKKERCAIRLKRAEGKAELVKNRYKNITEIRHLKWVHYKNRMAKFFKTRLDDQRILAIHKNKKWFKEAVLNLHRKELILANCKKVRDAQIESVWTRRQHNHAIKMKRDALFLEQFRTCMETMKQRRQRYYNRKDVEIDEMLRLPGMNNLETVEVFNADVEKYSDELLKAVRNAKFYTNPAGRTFTLQKVLRKHINHQESAKERLKKAFTVTPVKAALNLLMRRSVGYFALVTAYRACMNQKPREEKLAAKMKNSAHLRNLLLEEYDKFGPRSTVPFDTLVNFEDDGLYHCICDYSVIDKNTLSWPCPLCKQAEQPGMEGDLELYGEGAVDNEEEEEIDVETEISETKNAEIEDANEGEKIEVTVLDSSEPEAKLKPPEKKVPVVVDTVNEIQPSTEPIRTSKGKIVVSDKKRNSRSKKPRKFDSKSSRDGSVVPVPSSAPSALSSELQKRDSTKFSPQPRGSKASNVITKSIKSKGKSKSKKDKKKSGKDKKKSGKGKKDKKKFPGKSSGKVQKTMDPSFQRPTGSNDSDKHISEIISEAETCFSMKSKNPQQNGNDDCKMRRRRKSFDLEKCIQMFEPTRIIPKLTLNHLGKENEEEETEKNECFCEKVQFENDINSKYSLFSITSDDRMYFVPQSKLASKREEDRKKKKVTSEVEKGFVQGTCQCKKQFTQKLTSKRRVRDRWLPHELEVGNEDALSEEMNVFDNPDVIKKCLCRRCMKQDSELDMFQLDIEKISPSGISEVAGELSTSPITEQNSSYQVPPNTSTNLCRCRKIKVRKADSLAYIRKIVGVKKADQGFTQEDDILNMFTEPEKPVTEDLKKKTSSSSQRKSQPEKDGAPVNVNLRRLYVDSDGVYYALARNASRTVLDKVNNRYNIDELGRKYFRYSHGDPKSLISPTGKVYLLKGDESIHSMYLDGYDVMASPEYTEDGLLFEPRDSINDLVMEIPQEEVVTSRDSQDQEMDNQYQILTYKYIKESDSNTNASSDSSTSRIQVDNDKPTKKVVKDTRPRMPIKRPLVSLINEVPSNKEISKLFIQKKKFEDCIQIISNRLLFYSLCKATRTVQHGLGKLEQFDKNRIKTHMELPELTLWMAKTAAHFPLKLIRSKRMDTCINAVSTRMIHPESHGKRTGSGSLDLLKRHQGDSSAPRSSLSNAKVDSTTFSEKSDKAGFNNKSSNSAGAIANENSKLTPSPPTQTGKKCFCCEQKKVCKFGLPPQASDLQNE